MELISFRIKNTYFLFVFSFFFSFISCGQNLNKESRDASTVEIEVGAERSEQYLHLLSTKRIALVANHTSLVRHSDSLLHTVDYLISQDRQIVQIFSPEHGFRGKEDASAYIDDGKDSKTGLPIKSLYGKHRKPQKEDLGNIDLVVFDIQDVGVRFYTYISTLHYVMEACAENNIPLIVFDRPNPNGHYVDGPVLKSEHRTFVGMHEVPVVYGMTIGEYAQMINGEGWLENEVQCHLTVIPLKNYTHESSYRLPVRPSPNLPNDKAINLYPSLGYFEGTPINAGRGTEFQFQRYGAPYFPETEFGYKPKPNFGSRSPKHNGKYCYGVDLRNVSRLDSINIGWLVDAYRKTPDSINFFGPTFTAHAGNTELRKQLENGFDAEGIRASWQADIKAFKEIRSKYLIYD